jgi:ABC-type multidrug transport system fused ATPase/permease subunit
MDATREQVMAAARAACCDEFISALPNGYQTMLVKTAARFRVASASGSRLPAHC